MIIICVIIVIIIIIDNIKRREPLLQFLSLDDYSSSGLYWYYMLNGINL